MTTTATLASPAATLWTAAEIARDREAWAAHDLGAAFAGLGPVGSALAAWTEARARLARADAAFWHHPGAGAPAVAMIAA